MSGKDNSRKEPKQNHIPIKRVPLTDHTQLPVDYSATPGGTLFSTTPGGTRIIYDREFLIQCRNSPMSMTPPVNLPYIPGITHGLTRDTKSQMGNIKNTNEITSDRKKQGGDDSQFQIDI